MSFAPESAPISNPFRSQAALDNSCYLAYGEQGLVPVFDPGYRPTPLTEMAHESFRSTVLNPRFACLGAKAALNHNDYRFGHYQEMGDPGTTAGLARDLYWYTQEQENWDTPYATFAATFDEPAGIGEEEFEHRLWQQLQALHDSDAQLHHWALGVSSDPADPDFSFSFAGVGFFVVGLHAGSSRFTRRSAWPTLVFNRHDQFERLRQEGTMETMQEAIRARDLELQGAINPNLADYGEAPEARQYSGRAVENDWQCPFHAHRG